MATKPHATPADVAEIEHRFAFHPATTAEKRADHDSVRGSFRELAVFVATMVPNGRHKALALTALEEGMHWANAAIACTVPADAPERTAQPDRV